MSIINSFPTQSARNQHRVLDALESLLSGFRIAISPARKHQLNAHLLHDVGDIDERPSAQQSQMKAAPLAAMLLRAF